MSNPSETPREKLEEELEEIAIGLPAKTIEVSSQVRFPDEVRRETDYRFVISIVMVCGFLVLLGIPLVRGEESLLKTIASILAGPVGAVLGYYFGVRKREES